MRPLKTPAAGIARPTLTSARATLSASTTSTSFAKKDHYATKWDSELWEDNYVHMESDFGAEDYFDNAKPVIIFDKDLDATGDDRYLRYDPSTVFLNDVPVRSQLRTGTDYLGAYSFLFSLGFNDGGGFTKSWRPRRLTLASTIRKSSFGGIGDPSGCANAWSNWAIQFRRPSNARCFGQAFEWAGYLNYTKSLPQYQRDLSPANKFSYFFTNQRWTLLHQRLQRRACRSPMPA